MFTPSNLDEFHEGEIIKHDPNILRNSFAKTNSISNKELRNLNRIIHNKRMKYHLDLLKAKYELNRVDKIRNEGKETFMNDTHKELTNELLPPNRTKRKGKPTPVYQTDI
jgi:hypothetical protein